MCKEDGKQTDVNTDGPDEEQGIENMVGDEHQDDATKKLAKAQLIKKILVGLLIVGFIIYVIIDSVTTKNVQGFVNAFLEWVEKNPIAGIFVFIGVYILATVFFIPGSILTLGAGFVFSDTYGLGIGVAIGTITVFLGAAIGSFVAFLIGRYLLRDWVKDKLTKKYEIFEALDVSWQERGFRIMSLLRLSPIIPFNAINYIAGVTAISFRDYFWSTFLMLPGTILYVFLGASAKTLTDSANSSDDPTLRIVILVIGAFFGIAAVAVVSYYAKKELNNISERHNANNDTGRQDEEDHLDDEDQ